MEYMVLVSSGIGRIEDDVLKGLLNITEEVHATALPAPQREEPTTQWPTPTRSQTPGPEQNLALLRLKLLLSPGDPAGTQPHPFGGVEQVCHHTGAVHYGEVGICHKPEELIWSAPAPRPRPCYTWWD